MSFSRYGKICFILVAAFCPGFSHAQSIEGQSNEFFVPPGLDKRFMGEKVPSLPYGAKIGGSLRALEGSGSALGVPQGGNVLVIEVDPKSDTARARLLRDLGVAGSAEYFQEFEALNPDGLGLDVGVESADLLPNLTNLELDRFNELAAGLTELSPEELEEYQELIRRGLSNPDTGVPAPPPPQLIPTPQVILAACKKAQDNALICRNLVSTHPSYDRLCTCSES